jgi:putative DNA primase/helicase
MNVSEAIDQACASVGIIPPKSYRQGRWTKCDTLDGKSGKGDGRISVDDLKVTAYNWQIGQSATIWLKDKNSLSEVEKSQFAQQKAKDKAETEERAREAARKAQTIINRAEPSQHPYLAAKGFPHERALVAGADDIRRIGGAYLIPENGGAKAIVIPARIGTNVSSLQLIWENGEKKFLAGGVIEGSLHRISTGSELWLCEGFATGLALRKALKGLGRSPTILCCFSAYNVLTVARKTRGKCYIATDNDKPMEQFGGLGTGEYYARQAERPYVMPPAIGTDFDDMLMSDGIFAVQRHLANFAREARM